VQTISDASETANDNLHPNVGFVDDCGGGRHTDCPIDFVAGAVGRGSRPVFKGWVEIVSGDGMSFSPWGLEETDFNLLRGFKP
jgi:hypothetical protein